MAPNQPRDGALPVQFIGGGRHEPSHGCRLRLPRQRVQDPVQVGQGASAVKLPQRQVHPITGLVGVERADAGEVRVQTQVVWVNGSRPQQTSAKWGRTRTAPLPAKTVWGEPLAERLAAYCAALDDLLFPAPRLGGWWNPSNFARDRWTPARRSTPAWEPAWTWHSLRHTFCSALLERGAAVPDVSLAARAPEATVRLGGWGG